MAKGYPPIADYGYLSDCHSCALVSKAGSIDWACLPRFDSPSSFGRILDWEKGGFCRISPAGEFRSSRRYVDDTLVLETTFENDRGKARLTDLFTMKEGGEQDPHRQILRVVEGLEGTMDLRLECSPRFEYGTVKPWIRKVGDEAYAALGGSSGLLISGNFRFALKHRHDLDGTCRVGKGERAYLSLIYRNPEVLDEGAVSAPGISDLGKRLEETMNWWTAWASKTRTKGPYGGLAVRSAVVLKGLCNAPTGAIVAAPTTSLPESPGGSRNWDYRFTWIRDSCFAARSLAEIGFTKEADGFRRFVERSAAGSAEELQILFGVGGERRLREETLDGLEGYDGARPVRVGNAAENQVQLDVYGELLNLSWLWFSKGHAPDDDYWEFLTGIVETVAGRWRDPERGIWERPSPPFRPLQGHVLGGPQLRDPAGRGARPRGPLETMGKGPGRDPAGHRKEGVRRGPGRLRPGLWRAGHGRFPFVAPDRRIRGFPGRADGANDGRRPPGTGNGRPAEPLRERKR